ncbi:hypothetical protein Lser_V15G45347 [Lactuca serriola]
MRKEDVLGVLGEVHNDFHVSKEKVTLDAFVEGESDVHTKVCDSEVINSESGVSNIESQIKKPIIQDVQIYQTLNDCVQKSSNVRIQKCEEKRKNKNKNKSKMKKVWMPKVQVPHTCEKVQKTEVKNVQRKFNFCLDEYVRSWRKKKKDLRDRMRWPRKGENPPPEKTSPNGATYQRLVNQMFEDKLGDTMEVYIDGMVVKSNKVEDHLKDIKDAFKILDEYNMKRNPSKCHFGVRSGKFLGYMVTKRGIEENTEQIKSIIDLKSPSSTNDI